MVRVLVRATAQANADRLAEVVRTRLANEPRDQSAVVLEQAVIAALTNAAVW